jgi:hypothetical protein
MAKTNRRIRPALLPRGRLERPRTPRRRSREGPGDRRHDPPGEVVNRLERAIAQARREHLERNHDIRGLVEGYLLGVVT